MVLSAERETAREEAVCGICGIVSFNPAKTLDKQILTAMCQSLTHRGPDDWGMFVDSSVGLGITRLSIIDIEGGRQPMSNEDKTIWIVFNGEIYNFLELRPRLENLGHYFSTDSDTEVILHAYEQFGKECVNLLNGMFAFAIWDKPENKLFVARDRVGIKPLHYTFMNGSLIFGSELKAILVHPESKREINLMALNEYLSFEYVPSPHTIFEGVHKLPSGCTLTFTKNGVHVERYWDITFSNSKSRSLWSEAEYTAQLRQVLRKAVGKEMISDVPLGVFLSGGVDSSAIAAMMSEISPGQVKSFSVGFPDRTYDESRYARLVARHLSTDHYQLILEPRVMCETAVVMADFLDEPCADPAFIPHYLLSQYASQHVKVILCGIGGDELFAGYPTMQAHRLARYYEKLPVLFRDLIANLVRRIPVSQEYLSFDFKAKRFVTGISFPPEVRHHVWMGAFTPGEKKSLFLPWLNEALREKNTYDILNQLLQDCDTGDLFNRILYLDMKLYMENNGLYVVDRASMACSLEARVPLLNQTVVEFVTSVPFDLKLKGLRTKHLLRGSIAGLIPEPILKRPKQGFAVPVAKWIDGELKPLVCDMLSESRLKVEGLFDYKYVQKLLREHFEHKQDNRKQLWALLVFELWYDKYVKGTA